MSIPVQREFRGRFYRNRGFLYERTKHNELEKAFADHWESENEERSGLSHGCGLLQNLFFDSKGCFFPRCTHQVTTSERYVAATVIQWLGTNCGFSFLNEALRSQGLYVAEIPKHEPLPEPEELSGLYARKFG